MIISIVERLQVPICDVLAGPGLGKGSSGQSRQLKLQHNKYSSIDLWRKSLDTHPGDMGLKWCVNTCKQIKITYSEAEVFSGPIDQQKGEEQRRRDNFFLSFFFF